MQKYVVCNADEGDPGAFMDRSLMEGDPHAVIEGMLIAGYAIGASKGFIYIRAEYPLAVERMQAAMEQARELWHAGRAHPGHGFWIRYRDPHRRRRFRLRRGNGADGLHRRPARRAAPEASLPRSNAASMGKPTIINNVETLGQRPAHPRATAPNGSPASAPRRAKARRSSRWPAKCNNTGLVEVPMGMTLRRDHLRHRRRHAERQEVQGGADRRAVRRLPDAAASQYPGGL